MHDLSRYSDDVRAVLEAQYAISHCMKGPDMKDWMALDISIGHLRTLMLLAGEGGDSGATISEIATRLDIGKPASSILVERLVQLGLARRTEDANDRRRTLVTLTQAGDELIARLRQGNIDRFAQWLEVMSPADLTALCQGMQALRVIAERTASNPQTETTNAQDVQRDTVGVTSGTNARGE